MRRFGTARLGVVAALLLATLVGCGGRSGPPSRRSSPMPDTVGLEGVPLPLGRQSGHHRHQMAPGGPVAPGFVPVSVSALNARDFWVLGAVPCGDEPCTTLVRTTDGGQRFVGLSAPVAQLGEPAEFRDPGTGVTTNIGGSGTASADTVTDVAFVNRRLGLAYGDELFVTTDGGGTWTWLPAAGDVRQVAVTSHSVLLLGSSGLRFGRAGGGWHTVSPQGGLPGAGSSVGSAAGKAGTVALVSAGSRGSLVVRIDQHGRLHSTPVDCADGAGQVARGSDGSVWLLCEANGGARLERASGRHRFARLTTPILPAGRPVLAAANASTAVVGDEGNLLVTADGGARWTAARTPGLQPGERWRQIVFSSPSTALAVSTGSESRLWRSDDGGAQWQVVSFG